LDALITPVLPCPSFDIGQGADFMHFLFFNSLFNFVDMPSSSIPISLCEDTNYLDKYNNYYTKILKKGMAGSQGLPHGILIATLPKQDEKFLELTKEIDLIYDFRNKHGSKVLGRLKNIK
jgi:Asp-tRNA(Asn)/Glu-tRNA(Gln) amidotransferase A subunit family amidase